MEVIGAVGRWQLAVGFRMMLGRNTWTRHAAIAGLALLMAGLVGGAMASGTGLPDGGEIAFESAHRGNREIFLMDIPRRLAVNLTRHQGQDCCPAWLGDGDELAFVSWRGGQAATYVMRADGRRQRWYSAGSLTQFGPGWSPDRQRVTFQYFENGNWEVYVRNADGSGLERLTENTVDDTTPAWRPR
jgi:Tol biopolymer transport system component